MTQPQPFHPLRATLLACLAVVAVAAAIALLILLLGQDSPEIGRARIQWGEQGTTLSAALNGTAIEFMLAWAAVTLAILIALAVTLFVLTTVAAALALSALATALPLLVIGGIVWWVVRRNQRSSALAG